MQSSMTLLTHIPASMAGRMPKKNRRKAISLLKAMTRFCELPMGGRGAGADFGAGGEHKQEGLGGEGCARRCTTNSVSTTQQVSLVKSALASATTTQTRNSRSWLPWLRHASSLP
jgi:hypothetical protein